VSQKRSDLFIISLLGGLSVVTPFSIDLYLPAFPTLAKEFAVPTTTISLTLSSYFIGLALGQVFYGPLLDRFGRKRPLSAGLALYLVSTIGCAAAPSANMLIALRFVQGFGGCVAQVASITMVRDFFPAKDCAKYLSLLFLFIAASPLLAPIVGNSIIQAFGWKAAFFALAGVVAAILAMVCLLLPEGHTPDPSIALRPGPIVAEYLTILRHPRFATYAIAGAFSFAGLFTYVAGSPIIFREGFGLSANEYSLVFAGLACGFIGCSQLNVLLLRSHSSEGLFFFFVTLQVITGAIFLAGSLAGGYSLAGTLALLFVFLGCVGLTNPNASALAISPFTKNAGSASALLGFFQLGIGALISTGIGALSTPADRDPLTTNTPAAQDGITHSILSIIAILAVTAAIALVVLLAGRKRAQASPISEEPNPEGQPELVTFGH
jgi:DHA1 family bicyclomycin/chloramphenicol resistance-like MFS transporter